MPSYPTSYKANRAKAPPIRKPSKTDIQRVRRLFPTRKPGTISPPQKTFPRYARPAIPAPAFPGSKVPLPGRAFAPLLRPTRMLPRFVPGLGWGLLLYDLYDIYKDIDWRPRKRENKPIWYPGFTEIWRDDRFPTWDAGSPDKFIGLRGGVPNKYTTFYRPATRWNEYTTLTGKNSFQEIIWANRNPYTWGFEAVVAGWQRKPGVFDDTEFIPGKVDWFQFPDPMADPLADPLPGVAPGLLEVIPIAIPNALPPLSPAPLPARHPGIPVLEPLEWLVPSPIAPVRGPDVVAPIVTDPLAPALPGDNGLIPAPAGPVFTALPGSGLPPTISRGSHRREPPRKNEKERKGKLRKGFDRAMDIFGDLTELADIVGVAWDSLPDDCKTKTYYKGRVNTSFADKSADVYRCAGHMDIGDFIIGLIENHYQDMAIGLQSKLRNKLLPDGINGIDLFRWWDKAMFDGEISSNTDLSTIVKKYVERQFETDEQKAARKKKEKRI